MADTLAIAISVTHTPDSSSNRLAITMPDLTKTVTILASNPEISSGVQSVSTSEETFETGSVTAVGYIALKNIDSTNYVEFGAQQSGSITNWTIKLLPGEVAVFRLSDDITQVSTNNLRAKSNSAAVDVQWWIWEA